MAVIPINFPLALTIWAICTFSSFLDERILSPERLLLEHDSS